MENTKIEKPRAIAVKLSATEMKSVVGGFAARPVQAASAQLADLVMMAL